MIFQWVFLITLTISLKYLSSKYKIVADALSRTFTDVSDSRDAEVFQLHCPNTDVAEVAAVQQLVEKLHNNQQYADVDISLPDIGSRELVKNKKTVSIFNNLAAVNQTLSLMQP